MLTVLLSAKGSPGVTTSALALASAWPSDSATVLVEADPSGGDLGIRLRRRGEALPATPTVATLAARARDDEGDLEAVPLALNESVRVVPGFQSPSQGRGMAGLWPSLAAGLRRNAGDALVDIGRFAPSAATAPLVDAADVIVLVVVPTTSSLVHARDLASLLQHHRAVLQPLIVTEDRVATRDRADVDEVFAAAGLTSSGCVHLAWDTAAVGALEGGADPRSKMLARTRLIRSAHIASDRIVEARNAGLLAGAP